MSDLKVNDIVYLKGKYGLLTQVKINSILDNNYAIVSSITAIKTLNKQKVKIDKLKKDLTEAEIKNINQINNELKLEDEYFSLAKSIVRKEITEESASNRLQELENKLR